MPMLTAGVANGLWAGAAAAEWMRYRLALRQPLVVQQRLLRRYLRGNADTAFGRERDFARLAALPPAEIAAAYQQSVPLVAYDDLEPWIATIRRGASGVLTARRVRRLVPSSGSTAAVKLLPFTDDSHKEMSRAVDAWIADLFATFPSLLSGRAYWSITPAFPSDEGGPVPVGFDSDSEYLGGARARLARAVLAVPDCVSRLPDPEAFRYVSLLFLARARDLRLISVWHPSFLLRLLDALPAWIDRIADDIARGTLSPPGEMPEAVRTALQAELRPDRSRAAELRRLGGVNPRDVWPALALLSCWGDGAAYPFAETARARLPQVALQPKGLVATEGIVTIPFRGRHPLAVRSHVFEFLDDGGKCLLPGELSTGGEYAVVLTTGAGLYRYRLGDRVLVDGWIDGTPSLRFVGKVDRVSDYVGEKLSDGFVAGVLATLFHGQPPPRFAMLAPERLGDGYVYTLFLESDHVPADLAPRLERELGRNPHYAWCIAQRQLARSRVASVGPGADQAYIEACAARGQRLGDVKPAALDRGLEWRQVLPAAINCP